jgi:type VI protein secretion system component VasK
MSDYLDLTVLRNVAVVALVAGVGITVLFSVAVRAMTAADEQPGQSVAGPRLLAAGCLLIMAATVAVGLWAVLAK